MDTLDGTARAFSAISPTPTNIEDLVVVQKKTRYIELFKPIDHILSGPQFAVPLDSWRDNRSEMQVKPHLPFKITLKDGTPIVQVLDEIQRSVVLMLRDFERLLN
jgi:hypothetical protein